MDPASEAATRRRENLTRYREACRREQIGPRYSGALHLLVINLVYLGAMGLGLGFGRGRLRDALWLVPVAWLVANIGEYFLHRGPMHHLRPRLKRLYKRHAATHHRFFTHEAMSVDGAADYAIIFLPAWLHAILVFALGLPIVTLVGWGLGWERAALFGAGVASYILAYEWLHLAAHLPPRFGVARWPILGGVHRHHRRHHDPRRMRHINFSIFFPLADLIFGTLRRDDSSGSSREA